MMVSMMCVLWGVKCQCGVGIDGGYVAQGGACYGILCGGGLGA